MPRTVEQQLAVAERRIEDCESLVERLADQLAGLQYSHLGRCPVCWQDEHRPSCELQDVLIAARDI